MSNLSAETLTIEGPDAIAFAHAQLTSDVRQLAPGTWQWSAWLNPQGRVRALVNAWRTADDRLQLLLRGGTARAMAAALAPYVLRKRVTLAAGAPVALVDAPPRAVGSVRAQDGAIILGFGTYAVAITPCAADGSQRWRAQAIAAGHPWLPTATLDALLAPALSLQALGAVQLDKGCYPGQEIVARLHYRGGCKQRIRRVESAGPLPAGSPFRFDGAPAGTLLDAVDTAERWQALAVVRDSVPRDQVCITIDGEARNVRTFSQLQ